MRQLGENTLYRSSGLCPRLRVSAVAPSVYWVGKPVCTNQTKTLRNISTYRTDTYLLFFVTPEMGSNIKSENRLGHQLPTKLTNLHAEIGLN